jgi:hypothetical protein
MNERSFQHGALQGNAGSARVLPYRCRPLERLDEVLACQEHADAEYFSMPDQLEHISEVVAAHRAFCKVTGTSDAVVSPRILATFRHNRATASVADFHKHLEYPLRQSISSQQIS